MPLSRKGSLEQIEHQVVNCTLCPRLVEWRERAAAERPARFRTEAYWARPIPGFGDPNANVLIVGLAPAAHGGNRTGRIFTGDRSGDWLFRALHRAGFANQPTSVSKDDGLELSRCWVTAVVRCAPPDNKPTPQERDRCIGYLIEEIRTLSSLRAIVALGSFAWDGCLRALSAMGSELPSPKPKFGHEAVTQVGGYHLVGSYHPSQQNTFTGKLTEPQFDSVFAKVNQLVSSNNHKEEHRG